VGVLFTTMRKCELFIDGSSRGNPGEAGCGFIIYCEGKKIIERSIYLGIKTNNEAEYHGLLEGLKAAKEAECEDIIIYSDSELLVNHINGVYRVRASNLKPLRDEALNLLKNFKSWQVIHISRDKNFETDLLAKNVSKEGKNGKN